jgi:hypothetical protein
MGSYKKKKKNNKTPSFPAPKYKFIPKSRSQTCQYNDSILGVNKIGCNNNKRSNLLADEYNNNIYNK